MFLHCLMTVSYRDAPLQRRTIVNDPVERLDGQNHFCDHLKKREQLKTPVDVFLSIKVRISLLVGVKEADTATQHCT